MRILKNEEHKITRQLWEDVFREDTAKFLDYYYENMADHNQIYVIEKEGELASMLHLNPYEIQLLDRVDTTDYIVAVATKEKFRKQGMMGGMLTDALNQMYENHRLVTYLMPAAEAIYTPYGFVTVGGQVHYKSIKEIKMEQELENGVYLRFATEEDCEALSVLANAYLARNYDIFIKRSELYFKQLIKEQESQGGGIVLVTLNDVIQGYFLMSTEGDVFVREPILNDSFEMELVVANTPKIMIRIINVEEILSLFYTDCKEQKELHIYDPLITANTGSYLIETMDGKIIVKKISSSVDESKSVSIEQLTEELFSTKKILLNEIV